MTGKGKTKRAPTAKSDIVNLTELARLSGKTMPTLQKLIAEHDDFPIVERGTNGVGYKFSAAAVAKWFAALEEKQRKAAEDRAAELEEIQASFFTASIDAEEVAGLSFDERNKLANAKFAENKLAEQQRRLVRADEIERVIETAFTTLRRRMTTLPSEIAKECQLDRETRVRIEASMRAALDDCADGVAAAMGTTNREAAE